MNILQTSNLNVCGIAILTRTKYRSLGISCKCLSSISGHRILYFGSDEFSIGPLRCLRSKFRNNEYSASAVKRLDVVYSTSETKTKGKKLTVYPLIHSFVIENGLNGIHWPHVVLDPNSIRGNYDFGIVASFGHLIPEDIMSQFNRGIVNIHPSLLPRWRGSAPIEHTLMNNDHTTGISIIELSVGKFDHGRILLQKTYPVPERSTVESLTEELSAISGPLVLDVLNNFDTLQANARPQGQEGRTYAPKIKKSMGRVNWSEHSVAKIDSLYRAIGGKVGLYTTWEGKRVKLLDISPLITPQNILDNDVLPGSCFYSQSTKCLHIKCKDGWIAVGRLHVEYKVESTAENFFRLYVKRTVSDGISSVKFH